MQPPHLVTADIRAVRQVKPEASWPGVWIAGPEVAKSGEPGQSGQYTLDKSWPYRREIKNQFHQISAKLKT